MRTSIKKRIITLIALVFVFQSARGAFLNTYKYISVSKKINQLERLSRNSQKKNTELKSSLTKYQSAKSIEAFARNNFKLAASDEVLVVIGD